MGLLAVPGLLFLGFFFLWPVAEMFVRSLTDPALGIGNYVRFVESPTSVRSLVTTFRTALITTLSCLVVGYPYAYLMSVSRPRIAGLLLVLIWIPSLLSFLVRTFAFQVLLRDTGVINDVLIALGLVGRPLPLIRNEFAVILGTTSLLLPLMVLPVFAVLRRMDPDCHERLPCRSSACAELRRVVLPLSLPGVAAGSLLVFLLCLGAYITPAVLGDGRSTYVSEVVAFQFQHLEWGYGSAVAMILLAAALTAVLVVGRIIHLPDVFGAGHDR